MIWYEHAALFVLFIALPKVRYLFMTSVCQWTKRQLNWFQRCGFLMVVDFSAYWNGYEMHGFDKVAAYENCLLVGYHSRCTVDIVYLLANIQPSTIATYLMFKIPVMSFVLSQFNILPSGSGSRAEMGFITALSATKRPLLLLPGGVFECLKPLAQIGKIQWKKVPGFARIIHKEQQYLGSKTKVVPFYTKNCDRLLYRSDFIYETCGAVGRSMYSKFKKGHYYLMPLMLTLMFLAVGIKLVPRPVKLDAYFGEAVILKEGESVEDFSARIASATQELVDKVEAMPQREFSVRHDSSVKQSLLFWGTGAYTVVQNAFLVVFILFMIWSPVIVLCYFTTAVYAYAV